MMLIIDITCQSVNDYRIRRLPTATVPTSSDDYCVACWTIICSVIWHINDTWPSFVTMCLPCFCDILPLFLTLFNFTQHFTVWCRYVSSNVTTILNIAYIWYVFATLTTCKYYMLCYGAHRYRMALVGHTVFTVFHWCLSMFVILWIFARHLQCNAGVYKRMWHHH